MLRLASNHAARFVIGLTDRLVTVFFLSNFQEVHCKIPPSILLIG